MITFMQACKDAGATAIGQGNNYMGNTGIHVDIALIGQSKDDIDGIFLYGITSLLKSKSERTSK